MKIAVVASGLAGGALLGLASAMLLLVHGRIAGVSGILVRATKSGPGRTFRFGFLTGMIGTGAIFAAAQPSVFGAAVRSMPVLAIAGLLVGFGTTLGNGCTSGHGVCGISRWSPRSLVAVMTFMVTAALTVAVVGPHS
jgi:uncharacterized membrane protein YedE/YeeE